MKLNKKVMTFVLAGVMTVGAFTGALAAGLGTVDMGYLMQQHRDFNKAAATWQSDVKAAQSDFASQSKDMKDNNAKQALAKQLTEKLNQQRQDVFGPLEKDVLAKIKLVKDEKGLDYIALKGAVVIGDSTDVTKDVAAKLK